MADLHQELAVLSELEHHVVVVTVAVLAAAVAADPDVTFVIDEDAVVGVGPVVVFAGSSPVARLLGRSRGISLFTTE